MKKEDISKALGELDDELLLQADNRRRKRKPRWLGWVAMAACLCLVVGLAVPLLKPAPVIAAGAICEAEYEEMPKHPLSEDVSALPIDVLTQAWEDWTASYKGREESGIASAQAVNTFSATTIPHFLSNAGTENKVYSPANLYMALAMVAELSDGDTRSQILELLAVEDIEALRQQVQHMWKANYCDDGLNTCVLANSLWLNDKIQFRQSTMERLAETYRASSFRGTMGDESYDALLQGWLKEQTGGMLDGEAENLRMDRRTILAIASTIYFKSSWEDVFDAERTAPDTFYAPDGEKTVDFMNSYEKDVVYWGENFTAIKLELAQGCAMWTILPDEGYTVDEVLANDETFAMIASENWEKQKEVMVRLKMPKFDVSSETDLVDGLQALGVADAFDPKKSDYSPMATDSDGIMLSQVTHAARVMVNEEGCEASAFVLGTFFFGADICDDEIDFILDRPFVFVLTGVTDQPLFAGVVNQP